MKRIKTLIKELYSIETSLWDYEPKDIVKAIEDIEKEEKYRSSTLLELIYNRFADIEEETFDELIHVRNI